ncbi:hypothetical protein [Alicyclobacillus shizuokensis]|uniref:hypothetical protein n=1 Tax=Alicyclobacillus shizuokensis TaxID=392014 RepID=UPI00082AC82C|nr:hypothetical protein [Alicyclobacillus shizuokensis]MCL6625572.1 hypothetical protein [Alicyclobacillus shizuokensis]
MRPRPSRWCGQFGRLLLVFLCCFFTLAGARASTVEAASGLGVAEADIFFLPDEHNHRLQIVEQLRMHNPGHWPQDVTLPLPHGAHGVQMGNHAWVRTDGGVRVARAATAGSSTLTVTYWVSWVENGSVVVNVEQAYPVEELRLYLPIGDTALSASNLSTQTDTVAISGTVYRVFTHPGLAAHEDLPVSIQQLPTADAGSSSLGLPVIGKTADSTVHTAEAVGNLLLAAVVFLLGLLGYNQAGRRGPRQLSGFRRPWRGPAGGSPMGPMDETSHDVRRDG